MAAEGEFAFVIAVFSVGHGLIGKDLYASLVLAVLLSTIIPPLLLQSTINYYNRKAQDDFQKLVSAELERKHDLDHANNLENVTNCDNSNSTPGSTGGGGGGMVPMTSDPSGGSGGAPFPHQVSNYNSPSNLNLHNMDHLMLSASQRRRELDLVGSIRDQTAVQSHSEGRWGLMHSLMSTLAKLGLDVIDHRAWHP